MIYFILALAASLRLILINQSFWLDEAASLILARQSLTGLFASLAGDFHPPLYYLLLHFWLQLGVKAEWFLRLPNIVLATATVYLLYLLFKKAFAGKVPRLVTGPLHLSLPATAALFLALNPLHIYYSQELRMFALTTFLAVASWYALVSFQKKARLKWSLFWGVATLLNFYTFYGSFFNLLAQLVYLVIIDRPSLKKLLPWTLLSFLLFIPWLPTLYQQLQGSRFLTQTLPGWAQLSGDLSLKNLGLLLVKFTLGRINLSSDKLYLLAAGVSLLYIFSLLALSFFQKLSRLFWLWLAVPLGLAILLSLKLPMLGYWRYIYLLPAFATLLSIGIFHLPAKLSLANILLLSLTFLFSNFLFWTTPSFHRENWRQAAQFVSQKQDEQTVTIFAFSDAFAPIRWYAPNLNYAAPLSGLSLKPDMLDLELSQATLGKDTVFYFEYLSELTDPQDNIPAWLQNAGYSQVDIHNFSGVGFVYQFQHQL